MLGPKVQHTAVLEILARLGGPEGLRTTGRPKLHALAARHTRLGQDFANAIWQALSTQTITVAGTHTAEIALPKLAHSLKTMLP